MQRTNDHSITSPSPLIVLRAERALVAAACVGVCGWAVSLAWLWLA